MNSQACSASGIPTRAFFPLRSHASPPAAPSRNPWGATLQPPPTGNPADIVISRNAAAIANGAQLFSFADYNRANKLPYTINQTLDIQWQPRKDLAIDIGYVGNLGRHEIVPIPFNQAGIATPSHPIHGQQYTYGYTVLAPQGCNPTRICRLRLHLPTAIQTLTSPPAAASWVFPMAHMLANYEGGNIDLRVPYIGYSSESESYTAAGISAYNALQVHVEKRMSHGLQVGFSYTYSHATDEQSAMGLFYNGNNATQPPQRLRPLGFRPYPRHQLHLSLPAPQVLMSASSWRGNIADGWAIPGLAVIQSGQPYSVIDYSGAVGSIYYGTTDGITNPIVPSLPAARLHKRLYRRHRNQSRPASPQSQLLHRSASQSRRSWRRHPRRRHLRNQLHHRPAQYFPPSWQRRADLSIVKMTQLTERVSPGSRSMSST